MAAGYIVRNPGSLTLSKTQTGLTNGTSYEFQVVLRNAVGTVPRTYEGTVSVSKP